MKEISLCKRLTLSALIQIILLKDIISGSNPDYLGCYNEDANQRDLDGYVENLPSTNTPQTCQDLCKHRGFQYAGVQQGTQCSCGDIYGQYGQVTDHECDSPCPGDNSEHCGGDGKLGVYKTGLRPLLWTRMKLNVPSGEKLVDFDADRIDGINFMLTWALTEPQPGEAVGKLYCIKIKDMHHVVAGATAITVGTSGVFVSDLNGHIYRRDGITLDDPGGSAWKYVEAILLLFQSGPKYVYGMDSSGYLYWLQQETLTWNLINSGNPETGVMELSVSDDVLWLTKSDEIVYRSGLDADPNGVRGSFPNDNGIIHVATHNFGKVAALDANGTVYVRDGVTVTNRIGTRWIPVDRTHNFTRIAVYSRSIFALDDNGNYWRADSDIDADEDYFGCFEDGADVRGLQGFSELDMEDLTIQKCRKICSQENYVYAGLQQSTKCFCGNEYHASYARVPNGHCYYLCSGNRNEICGTYLRNSVYKTVVNISPNQSIALNEQIKLYCHTNAPLDVSVAWSRDGVVLQNRTEDTELDVSSNINGTFVYQCSVHHGKFSQSKNITVTVEDPVTVCARIKSLDDASRSATKCDAKHEVIMESLEADQWYEFYGLAGTQIPTSCVKQGRCGARMSGWMNGEHPDVEDGVVARQLCFSYKDDCCYHSVNINVRQCFGNYIYKFPKFPKYFQGRVCTEKEQHGTGPSSTMPDAVFYMSSMKTKDMALVGHHLATFQSTDVNACNLYCLLKAACKSYNHNRATKTCELNNKKSSNDFKNLTPKKGSIYYHPAGNTVRIIPQK